MPRQSEEDRLLSAVCEEPENDDPRLVFADWLEDHDQPERAEFIRVQITLARSADRPDAKALRARESALLKEHEEAWTRPLEDFASAFFGKPFEFRRGFVENIGTEGELLCEDGKRLFSLAPIREVRLGEEEEYEDLAKCKWLLRLRTLDLTGSGLSKHFGPAPLLRSRYLANLTTLRLCGQDDNGHLDIEGVRALIRSKHLGKLEELNLSGNWLNQFNRGTVGTFLAMDNMPALRALFLRGVGVLDAGAEAIASTPWMARVKVLDLSRNTIGDRGLRVLLESPLLAGIERLDLRNNLDREAFEDSQPIRPATRRLAKQRFGERVLL
jgi:uncharacterized protein (TIGR02996 family)